MKGTPRRAWTAALTPSRMRWLAGGGAVLLLVAVLAGALRSAARPDAARESADAQAPEPTLERATRFGAIFRATPKQGQVYTYRFNWTQDAQNHLIPTAQLPAELGSSRVALTGTLTLAVLVPKDAHTLVELLIDGLRPLGDDPRSAQLGALLAKDVDGGGAYLVLHPDGALQSIRFNEDAPPGFRNFVQRLVGLVSHTPAKNPSDYDTPVTETTPLGVATTKYELRGTERLYRSRVAYTRLEGLPPTLDLANFGQELDSGALFEFRADGVLSSIADTETMRLTKSDDGSAALESSHGFSLRLEEAQAHEAEPAPAHLASLAPHAPWERTMDEAAERQAVEDRLEGLTGPAMFKHVRAVAALGPRAPDQLTFFNRATGLLKLHPELSAEFPEFLHEPKMTYEGRAFALDLLASAGNEVVQAALVKSLRDPRTQALPEYISLYQRISLVRAPTAATVAFAEDTFERLHKAPPTDLATANLETASVYALGAVAGHMAETRRLDAAERICRRIVEKMEEGKGSPKVAYITALGNAAVPAQEPLLLRLSADADSETRAAAFNALRKYDTPNTRGRVLAVLTSPLGKSDVDRETQAEALRAFMLMTPQRSDIQAIAAAIVKDTLHRDLYPETIPLFRKGKAPLSDVAAALDAMFKRTAQHDSDMQTRIDTLRAELSALD